MAFNVPTTLRLEIISCCVCGIMFGLAEEFNSSLRETKKVWYCPNGHSQAYLGQTMEVQLAKFGQKNFILQQECERTEAASARKSKQITTLKKRLKNQTKTT